MMEGLRNNAWQGVFYWNITGAVSGGLKNFPADACIAENDKLTTEVMMQLMKNLMNVIPKQMVEAIWDTMNPRVFTAEHKSEMRMVLLPLFVKGPKKRA